jgi:alcohol dehydrogenase
MIFTEFNYSKIPPIYLGAGKLKLLPELIGKFRGQMILLVTGGKSLEASGKLADIQELLKKSGIGYDHVICSGEPTASKIDAICAEKRSLPIDVVVGIGGGSVVDAGKAISAMLPHENSIFDHLEGVGKGIPHSGIKLPYIAVTTTSGTGSEVTKNAVISEVGPQGYKKSLRHENLIPDAVIVDGELLVSCPRHVSAACGMDAFTQLLEPFLSPKVSPLTEAIAWSGLTAIKDNLLLACGQGSEDIAVRQGMAYASLLSGIALANDGLGIVHGLAGPIGGFFPIPHGVVCGTLMGAAVRANLKALRQRSPDNMAIAKMARLGQLLTGTAEKSPEYFCDALVYILDEWTQILDIPRLGSYGIQKQDFDKILDKTANRNNPIQLDREEIRMILAERL